MKPPLKHYQGLMGAITNAPFVKVLICFWLIVSTAGPSLKAADSPTSLAKGNIGMPIQLKQIVIPGTELEAIPLADEAQPMVVRIEAVWPHGSEFRYDFSFYGLEAGTFDLRTYLRRKDGSNMETAKPLPVVIESILKGDHAEPGALEHQRIPVPGGYKSWMTAIGIVWALGLVGILWSMRRRLPEHDQTTNSPPPLSLGEKLEPLVQSAASGTMSSNEKAELERLLLTFWSKKLDLKNVKSSVRIQQLKEHPEAKALLCAVEKWLHSPESADQKEIKQILKPYRSIQWEESSLQVKEGGG